MSEAIRKVNVIGHLHPDTDSICAAISYAYLKNQVARPPLCCSTSALRSPSSSPR